MKGSVVKGVIACILSGLGMCTWGIYIILMRVFTLGKYKIPPYSLINVSTIAKTCFEIIFNIVAKY